MPPVKSEYLERILKARVYDVAIESPLAPAATGGNTSTVHPGYALPITNEFGAYEMVEIECAV